jgi:hypothetical protein
MAYKGRIQWNKILYGMIWYLNKYVILTTCILGSDTTSCYDKDIDNRIAKYQKTCETVERI